MSENEDTADDTREELVTDCSHWVEQLFPPAFRLSLQELVDGSITTAVLDKNGHKLPGDSATGDHNDEMFVKLGRKTSPLDIDAIKNVYQRVWLMMNANKTDEDEETGQSDKVRDADIQCSLEPSSISLHSSDKLIKQDACIWDSNEIHVLRRAFKATSDENVHLRSQVSVLQDDVEKMTAERRTQRKLLESVQQRLHAAETVNGRLQLLVSHLKTERDSMMKDNGHLRSADEERNSLKSQLQKMELELSAAQSRQDMMTAAAETKWVQTLEKQRLEETMAKMQLNKDVAKLAERVKELELQLNQEKAEHNLTREGLEHLKVHFSSLHMSGDKSNLVHKDQLVNWTY